MNDDTARGVLLALIDAADMGDARHTAIAALRLGLGIAFAHPEYARALLHDMNLHGGQADGIQEFIDEVVADFPIERMPA